MQRIFSIPLRIPIVNSIVTKVSNIELPQRLRGGAIENMVNYTKNVYLDYKTVYMDTIQDARDRPLRATIIGSVLLAATYCFRHNPTQDDFEEQLIESNNKLSRVPESLRNEVSYQHVHGVFRLNNQRVLRHQSFGLFSIIYRVDYSSETDLFMAHCKYLQPSWKSYFTERIVDVGFCDRYHLMSNKMIDYDINQKEWPHTQQQSSTLAN